MESFIEKKLPIWSLLFINPTMARLKNKAPLREHHGRLAEERTVLPDGYIITMAFRKKDRAAIDREIPEILNLYNGLMLSENTARHEWENRFKVMLVKRLGPSLVPAEIVFPLAAMSKIMNEIEDKIAQPIVKEGIVIRDGKNGDPEVVILGFIPSDQRKKLTYTFLFSLSLSVMKIAEKHGGRAYSTGLYFSGKAPKVLGKERLHHLKAFKHKIDPDNFLNPGKVLKSRFISTAINTAGAFENVTRFFGNRVKDEIGVKVKGPVRDIPATADPAATFTW